MSLNPLRPFNSYLRPYKRQVIYGLILLFVSQAIQVSIPLVLMEAIDAGKGFLDAAREGLPVPQTWTGSTAGDLAWYAILLTVLGITSWCANFGLRWYFSGTSRYVERDLRTLYVRHIVNLPMSFFQVSLW